MCEPERGQIHCVLAVADGPAVVGDTRVTWGDAPLCAMPQAEESARIAATLHTVQHGKEFEAFLGEVGGNEGGVAFNIGPWSYVGEMVVIGEAVQTVVLVGSLSSGSLGEDERFREGALRRLLTWCRGPIAWDRLGPVLENLSAEAAARSMSFTARDIGSSPGSLVAPAQWSLARSVWLQVSRAAAAAEGAKGVLGGGLSRSPMRPPGKQPDASPSNGAKVGARRLIRPNVRPTRQDLLRRSGTAPAAAMAHAAGTINRNSAVPSSPTAPLSARPSGRETVPFSPLLALEATPADLSLSDPPERLQDRSTVRRVLFKDDTSLSDASPPSPSASPDIHLGRRSVASTVDTPPSPAHTPHTMSPTLSAPRPLQQAKSAAIFTFGGELPHHSHTNQTPPHHTTTTNDFGYPPISPASSGRALDVALLLSARAVQRVMRISSSNSISTSSITTTNSRRTMSSKRLRPPVPSEY